MLVFQLLYSFYKVSSLEILLVKVNRTSLKEVNKIFTHQAIALSTEECMILLFNKIYLFQNTLLKLMTYAFNNLYLIGYLFHSNI